MLRKSVVVALAMAVAAGWSWAGVPAAAVEKSVEKSAEKVAEKVADKAAESKAEACCKAGDTVYACAHCSVVDTKAGKCAKCKADLAATHVLAMKDGKVSLCSCEAGCKCTVKADDPKQCSCGKAVTTLDCATACVAAKKPEAPAAKADAPAAKADAPKAKADAPKAKTDVESAKPKDHPAH